MKKDIKYLIENIVNFNPTDYLEGESDVVDRGDISAICVCPENLDQLKKLVAKRLKENPKKPYLKDIDTSLITDMSGLFNSIHIFVSYNEYFWDYNIDSRDIEELDLSGWNTSNVMTMEDMFTNCEHLESLNLSGWDTSNVVNMASMFSQCQSLAKLDLSSFNTYNVTDMYAMFWKCRRLKTIVLSDKWSTVNVIDTRSMFEQCYSLTNIDFSNFYLRNNQQFKNGIDFRKTKMFSECPNAIKKQFKKQAKF